MEIDITQIVVAVIGSAVEPDRYLRREYASTQKVDQERSSPMSQWESILRLCLVAGVQAAEIIFNAQGKGAEKFAWAKEYIEQQCAAHGIKIDADTIQIAIENAWKALGLDQKQLPADKTVSEAE